MTDHRDPQAGDGDEPTPTAPGDGTAPGSGAGADAVAEPEFGSPEWLLHQLTGGRPVAPRPPAPAAPAEPAEAAEPAVEESAPVEPAPVEPAPVAPAAPAAPATGGGFETLLRSGGIPLEDAVSEPGAFTWNLTPDPSVKDPHAAPHVAREFAPVEPQEPVEPQQPVEQQVPVEPQEPVDDATRVLEVPPVVPAPVAAPSVPPAPAAPPAPAPAAETPTEAFDPTAFFTALSVPQPARQASEPEPPQPAATEPAAAERPVTEPPPTTGPLEGHGLAALLGLSAADEAAGAPAARSVIGDTTGIIPLPPGTFPPRSTTPPPASTPTASPQEPAQAPAAGPAFPVAPLPSPAFFEPDANASGADIPTAKLDSAEIAALLRAKTTDPDPDASPVAPAAPPAPAPAAAETELALGAPPSPATSPFDAESIAAASASEAIFTPQPELEEEDGDSGDGLSELFGDIPVHEEEPEPEPEQEAAPEVAPAPAPAPAAMPSAAPVPTPAPRLEPGPPTEPFASAEGLDTIPFAELGEAPAAAEEGPQFAPVFMPLAAAGATAATPPPPAQAVQAPQPPMTPAVPPVPPAGEAPAGTDGSGRPPSGAGTRRLLLIAAGLAVVFVLIGLFAIGTQLPSMLGASQATPAPSASAHAKTTPTPTPTPSATVIPKVAAAAAPGTHAWDQLGGGECVQPYTSPWSETFTVVDCATPHTAQMVYTNLVSADPAAPYPGATALSQQIGALCSANGLIDFGKAAAYPDLQMQGTFPATEQQWKSGQRSYYCFVSRSGGQPLTTSIAGTGPTG